MVISACLVDALQPVAPVPYRGTTTGRRILLLLILGTTIPTLSPGQDPAPAIARAGFNPQPADAPVEPGRLILQDRRDQVTLRRETGVTLPIDPPQELRPKERILTSPQGYALILGGRQALVLDQQTSVEVAKRALPGLRILQGQVYAKSLGAPTTEGIWVQWGNQQIVELTGTEFLFRLDPADGAPRLDILSGEVRQAPPELRVQRANPEDLAGFRELIQWVLYYPPVLDLDELTRELAWDPRTIDSLVPSWTAYRAGDLPQAFALYPAERTPATVAEELYRAALFLAAGRPEVTEATLARLGDASPVARFAHALQRTLRAVKLQVDDTPAVPELASEWLAESYYQQALLTRPTAPPRPWESAVWGTTRGGLEKARAAARRAVALAPDFGFAHERVAELEFSFGEIRAALASVERALQLTPTNAPAFALRGFLRGAEHRSADALADFQTALRLDSKLASAWLGQGLIRFQQGRVEEGLTSLQMAVLREPQRALYRSYLGKAYHEALTTSATPWDTMKSLWDSDTNRTALAHRAAEELALARQLDPRDPAPLQYSALLARSENRINQAVRDLEASAERNDQRALFRSSSMLDEDRAVRGAALAQVYRDAGMNDRAVREAGRAVAADYGNPSAHLFLASGYDQLRDPQQVNLRYDTPWQTELLLANLLRPLGSGSLSQTVSQQEFTRLFDREHTGIYSATEYSSQGEWRESASLYGAYDRVGFALDAFYQSRAGERPNADSEARTLAATLKLELTPVDEAYLEVRDYDFTGGDVRQLVDPHTARPAYRAHEEQEPLVLAGYHHRWAPGNHTLLLVSRLTDDFTARDPAAPSTYLPLNPQRSPGTFGADLDYQAALTLYATELQQIWRLPALPFGGTVGVRYQLGEFPTSDRRDQPTGLPRLPPIAVTDPLQDVAVTPGFHRFSFYSYQDNEVLADRLWLIGGLAVDTMEYPRNHRFSPISAAEDHTEMVAPKAGAMLRLDSRTTLQGVYSRWLGGVSFDQSFSLEPAQVAGFAQNYRDVFPAALTGSPSAPRNQLFGVLLDRRFATDTYVGLQAQQLEADADTPVGVFFVPVALREPLYPGTLTENVGYRERSLQLTVDQLLEDSWAINLRYRLTGSELDRRVLDFRPAQSELAAHLHELRLVGRWNHASGWFGSLAGTWRHQDVDSGPSAEVWQLDAELGYRLLQRRLELRLDLLNLTDADAPFTPVTPFAEWSRSRTLVASLKLNF